MEDPSVIEYLTKRVINLLRDNGFGYVKIVTTKLSVRAATVMTPEDETQVTASQEFFKK